MGKLFSEKSLENKAQIQQQQNLLLQKDAHINKQEQKNNGSMKKAGMIIPDDLDNKWHY
jgi:hypothetical protein